MGYRPSARKRLAIDRQQLLILLVAAVMSGSFFLLVLWPKQKELSALALAVERERTLVKQKVRTSREGVYVTVRVASLRKAGGALLRRVPAEPELASFLEQMAECVAEEPLICHEVERIEAEPLKGAPAIPIRLRLAGPFEAVYRCLGAIEGLERLTWFRRLEIRRADEEGGVAAEVEILVYYLPVSQDEELAGGDGQALEVAAG
ncbi:MAG: type 4a pilus biogenesis protein PilO [Phycisphaerae bacterium]